MIQVKDIKSIQIVPYTIMMSSISAVLSVIYAIFFIIILSIGAVSSAGANASFIVTLIIALLLLFPTAGFLLSIVQSFLTALIYNILVPKIGAIKLGFEDLKEIKNVPVVPFAFMISAISGIIVFIIMLIIGPILVLGLQAAALSASAAGTAIPGLPNFGGMGLIGLLILVIGVPIGMFILTFISSAIMTIFYNFLAPKIGGIQFNFGNAIGKFHEIESIPVVSFALITAIVITLFSFLIQVISLIISIAVGAAIIPELISLVTSIVVSLIFGFVIYAITAALYNYLQPRIGGIKLEIE